MSIGTRFLNADMMVEAELPLLLVASVWIWAVTGASAAAPRIRAARRQAPSRRLAAAARFRGIRGLTPSSGGGRTKAI